MASPILSALRTGTQQQHDELEAVTLGDRIMDGSLTPAEYRRLIDWQRRAHQALEPGVQHFTLDEYRYRERFPAVTASSLSTTDLATGVGTVYVLEGASLGGTAIYRKLLDNPALQEKQPFAFYRDQAEWGLAQWRRFVAALDQQAFAEEEIRQAVRAARAAFSTFERHWRTEEEDAAEQLPSCP